MYFLWQMFKFLALYIALPCAVLFVAGFGWALWSVFPLLVP